MVQLRKTRPYITERLLMGRKEFSATMLQRGPCTIREEKKNQIKQTNKRVVYPKTASVQSKSVSGSGQSDQRLQPWLTTLAEQTGERRIWS